MKKFIAIITAILFNCVAGGLVAGAAGFSPLVGAISMNGLGVVAGLFPPIGSALHADVYKEVWIGELINKLRAGMDGSWLARVPDMSSVVNNDVIHLVDVGADPEVLIDNTTYPLEIQELADGDKAISLNKFDSRPTPVTDDELYAISYDKMKRVIDAHGFAINEKQLVKAAHALCANSNSASTPVIATTGEADEATGRKTLTKKDLIAAKAAMDKLGVPATDRILVLCPDHVQDILAWSEQFERQYSLDNVNGKIGRIYGFDVYEFSANPYYGADGAKKAIGAATGAGDFQCSFAFYTQRVFKATGSRKMYYSAADSDPLYHRNLVDFSQRFVCLPKKADAGVVIRSGYVSSAAPTITGCELIDNVPATAGNKERTYNTSTGAAITAESDAAWLVPTVQAGNKVKFAYEAYAHAEEGDNPRIANVTLAIPGTSATLAVVVKQAMAES